MQPQLQIFTAEGLAVLSVAKKIRSWSGKKLRELRLAAKLTQSQLAEKADIRSAAISDYEHDKSEPTFTVLCRLAAALGVDLNAFSPSKGG
jgi:transcriptional regulator with XRE-family HTH domain